MKNEVELYLQKMKMPLTFALVQRAFLSKFKVDGYFDATVFEEKKLLMKLEILLI